MALRIGTTARNGMANALNTAVGTSSTLKIYTGSQPADPQTAVSGTLLATFALDATSAFGTASSGVITLDNSPALTVAAAATGTAGWFRIATSGAVGVLDGSVGTSGAELNLNTVALVSGVNVTITSGTFTQPAA